MKIFQRLFFTGLFSAIGWFLALGPALAQSGQLPAIISRLQASYAGMDAFQATFGQELHHRQSDVVEKRTGSLLFQKPMLIRWETAEPYPELLIVTSGEIWNYLPAEDLAYRYSLDMLQNASPIIVVLTGQQALDREFDVELLPNDGALIHLRLYPYEPSTQLTEAEVWVDATTFFIHSAISTDFYGNTNKITFTSMNAASKAPAGTFAFSPPPGTDVEDVTGGMATPQNF